MTKRISLLAASLITALPLQAMLNLDFGTQNLQPELDSSDQMSFGDIAEGATDVYARITTDSSYIYGSEETSGGIAGDARINQQAGGAATFTLSLYSDSGYTTLYDPGQSFTYNLFFYDIDGESIYHDEITMFTAASYEVTDTTELGLTPNVDGSLTVSGANTSPSNVAGEAGLATLTQDQADASISFTFTDQNQVVFEYNVIGSTNRKRNLLFDGNNLTFSGFDTDTGTVVPESNAFSLVSALFVLITVMCRRNRVS